MKERVILLRIVLFSVFLSAISCVKVTDEFGNSYFYTVTESLLEHNTKACDSDIDYVIDEDMIREYYHQTSPRRELLSIDPYVENGSKPLYIVNFEDGWHIVSSDTRSDFVLAKGQSGRYDVDSTPQYQRVWIASMSEQLSLLSGNINPQEDSKEWGEIRARVQNNSTDTRSLDPDQDFMWLVCLLSQSDTTIVSQSIPHLLPTKWGQSNPWNASIPYNMKTGCVATAVSQVLYYFNYSIGTPSDLYHTITVNSSTNKVDSLTHDILYHYSVSRSDYSSSSPRWSQMPLDSVNHTTTNTGYVSDLMFDVGTRLNTWYGSMMSFVEVNPNNDFVLTPVNLTYTCGSYSASIHKSIIINNLTNNKPVIVTASYSNIGTHTWVIDGYLQENTIRTKYVYYVKVPIEDVVDYEDEYNIIYRASSLQDMLRVYPGFVDGTYNQVVSNTYHDYYLINWGKDGEHNDDLFASFPDNSWNGYSSNVFVYYNITPGQLAIGNN